MLENHVNTFFSNVRVLKRVPKDSRVPLAENLSDKIIDIFYNLSVGDRAQATTSDDEDHCLKCKKGGW